MIGVKTGLVLGSSALNIGTTLRSHVGYPVRPPDTVSINLPVHYEDEGKVKRTIRSIYNQNVVREYPEYFELFLLGCEGMEMEHLSSYVDRVACPPKGKLNARDVGFRESWGNIIVAIDSDSYYPPNFLNRLLYPLNDPEVVATTSRTKFPLDSLYYPFSVFFYRSKIHGRGSAIRKDAYFKIGGFNLNIEQTNWDELGKEEEWRFTRRLRKAGKIEFVDVVNYTEIRPNTERRVYSNG